MASVGSPMNSRWRRIGTALVVLLGVLSFTAGCGEPQFRYVANSDEQTYFKVPHSWHELDSEVVDDSFDGIENNESIAAEVRRQLWWSVAYDSDKDPAPKHLTAIYASDSPVLYVSIRRQVPAQQNVTSFDLMRDLFLPVTEAHREALKKADQGLNGFEALYDEVINAEDGVHGVRSVFNYELSAGVLHTFDQTVYANQDSTVLYFMLIRCTARCYRERAVELNDIATSFTVRSKA